jgi:formylglycine-generating enzyme
MISRPVKRHVIAGILPAIAAASIVSLALPYALAHGANDSPIGPVVGKVWALQLADQTSIDLEPIAAGKFFMGSAALDPLAKPDEKPQTEVAIRKPFWMGRTMVTIGQWKSVMGLDVRGQLSKVIADDTLYDFGGKMETVREYMVFSQGSDPGQYLAGEDDDLPMYFVSWNDAMEFCNRLNATESSKGRLPKGYEYTLPTEAQWEYACRAGTTADTYAGPLAVQDGRSPALDGIAWYDGNSPEGYTGKGFNVAGRTGGPHPVGQKRPNAWGLYDMAGELWEWCRDWYEPYPGGSVTDPTGPATGSYRVNRGGSFGSGPTDERSANRAKSPPAEASAYRGFRLALCPAP